VPAGFVFSACIINPILGTKVPADLFCENLLNFHWHVPQLLQTGLVLN
jgi:hypothetical protein